MWLLGYCVLKCASVLGTPEDEGLRASTTKAGKISLCLQYSSHTRILCPLAKCTSILFLTGGNGRVVTLVIRGHITAEHRRGILNQFGLAPKPKIFSGKPWWPAKAGSKRCKHARSSRFDLVGCWYKQTPMGLDRTPDAYSSDRGLDTRPTFCFLFSH